MIRHCIEILLTFPSSNPPATNQNKQRCDTINGENKKKLSDNYKTEVYMKAEGNLLGDVDNLLPFSTNAHLHRAMKSHRISRRSLELRSLSCFRVVCYATGED